MTEQRMEKRHKLILSKDEVSILKSLFLRALAPVGVMVAISSFVLFKGFHFLMRKTSFYNYGVMPGTTLRNAADFIQTYLLLSAINLVLMLALAAIVIYLTLHGIILPLMRITRELRHAVDRKEKCRITVRQTDTLLIPLVELINRFTA